MFCKKPVAPTYADEVLVLEGMLEVKDIRIGELEKQRNRHSAYIKDLRKDLGYPEYIPISPKRSAGQFWDDRDLIHEQKIVIVDLKYEIVDLKRDIDKQKKWANGWRIKAVKAEEQEKTPDDFWDVVVEQRSDIEVLKRAVKKVKEKAKTLEEKLVSSDIEKRYWESKAKDGEPCEVSGTGYLKSVVKTEDRPTITITTSWDDGSSG